MAESAKSLVIISRDALLAALQGEQDSALLRLVASLSRKGKRVILTAPEPDRWVPTRRNVDQALVDQQSLTLKIRAAGGDLDGVYYVPRSLLTQDRNRLGALKDILARYGADVDKAVLISASAPFLKAAENLGIQALPVAAPDKPGRRIEAVLESVLDA